MSAIHIFSNDGLDLFPSDSFDAYAIDFDSESFLHPYSKRDEEQRTVSPFELSEASLSTTDESDGSLRSSPYAFNGLLSLDEEQPEVSQLDDARWDRLKSGMGLASKGSLEDAADRQRARRRSSIMRPLFANPSLIMPAPTRTRRSTASVTSSSDDADGDSDDNGNDQDYNPALEENSRKRRRGHCMTSSPGVSRKKLKLRKTTSASPSTSPKRPRVSPPSRNTQVSASTSAQLVRKVQATASNVGAWICPECDWEQTNRRMPDFKRHLKTHLRATNEDQHGVGHWCHGVPLEKAHLFDIPADAEPYTYHGHQMIGGCMRSFSRLDARKRHLDNHNMTCVIFIGE